MWLSKLKAIVAVILAVAFLTGGGMLSFRLHAEAERASKAPAPARPPAEAEAPAPHQALQPGERAVSIRVSTEGMVGGFVLPGSRVDVICTMRAQEATAKVILQNLRVLAVDQSVPRQPGPAINTVTLAVKPEEAARLTLAASVGELRLMLRAPQDTRAVNSVAARANDLEEPRPASTSPPGAAEETRAALRQQALEEVELLEVQVQVKQAHLAAAKIASDAAAERRARLQKSAEAVGSEMLLQARAESDAANAQLRIREAELREPMVRLAHVKRRLAALDPPAPTPPGKPVPVTEERLREAERKLDALRKELEELRRASRPEKEEK
jgi:Flp pilus assembly protein CpaB